MIRDRCLGVYAACGNAIDWVEQNRKDSPRLDRDSGDLTLRLRRARNKALRLADAALRPFAIGFFGLSQAGKSYLISALAASEAGTFDIAFEMERLSFLLHINPPGGGKEATGLVTRFTRRKTSSPGGFPIRLSLLSEADLVKLLGNAFFNDFDRERTPFQIDTASLRTRLSELHRRRQDEPLAGLTADDVVGLQDYFDQRFPRSTEMLREDFWPTAVTLAPYLAGEDRADLFSVLWGDVPELGGTFRLLRDALSKLNFARTVYSEIGALVTRDASGKWVPAASIIDVDVLDRLGRDKDDKLDVLAGDEASGGGVIAVPRSVLAALTAEIELVLADAPKADLLERVDMLDFPGYRGRLSIGSVDEVSKQLKDHQLDPVAQLVLRGKVAYLFEQYTEAQEMNALVLCTPSNQQSDVNDMGPVLQTWIDTAQGADAQTRSRRQCGLLWAVTKFDQRLDVVSGQTEDVMRTGWEGMMKLTLLERFGAFDWVHEWTPQHRFDNLFLVRKPGKAGAVIVTRGERELELQEDQKQRLASLRKTFCEHPLVRKHIREPDVAWDAMLLLNDGGMSRVIEYLRLVADPQERMRRICEQIESLADDIGDHRLGAYYRAQAAADVARKERIAGEIIASLHRAPQRIGDLIHVLQPSREQLRALYLRGEEQESEDKKKTQAENRQKPDPLFDVGDLSDIIGDVEPDPEREASDNAKRYARDAVRSWVSQIRDIAEQERMRAYFGLSPSQFDNLVEELIIGADRLKLEQMMADVLEENEKLAGTRREQIAARQAYRVASVLSSFADYLDDHSAQLEGDTVGPEAQRRFAPVEPILDGMLPELPASPEKFSARFIGDWFRAFKSLAVNNAGHDTGTEISPEANHRLGEIIARLKDSAPECVDAKH